MPKPLPTALQAAAAKQDEEKKKRSIGALLGKLAGALGLAPDATAKPSARRSKVTEKYTERKERMEETDSAPASAEEEEEEEAEDSEAPSTAKSGAESSEPASGEDAKKEEEEEEGAAPKGKRAESEEEEEGAIARGWAAAHKAYKATVRKAGVDAYAIHGPIALWEATKKATGQTTVAGALGALSALPARREHDAKLARTVEKLQANDRASRIGGIVDKAKIEGVAGATTTAGRASLRALGMAQGSAFLKAHVATLPRLRKEERIPRQDGEGNALGAPTEAEQARIMEQSMGGLSEKDREAFKALAAEKLKAANGAGRNEP